MKNFSYLLSSSFKCFCKAETHAFYNLITNAKITLQLVCKEVDFEAPALTMGL